MPAINPFVAAIVDSVITAIVEESTMPTPVQVPVYSAMARNFPANAAKGELTPPIQQAVLISGKTYNASPGLQIRNDRNLITMPGSLQQTVPVRYQLDQMGNVWRIWILSANEVAAPDPQK